VKPNASLCAYTKSTETFAARNHDPPSASTTTVDTLSATYFRRVTGNAPCPFWSPMARRCRGNCVGLPLTVLSLEMNSAAVALLRGEVSREHDKSWHAVRRIPAPPVSNPPDASGGVQHLRPCGDGLVTVQPRTCKAAFRCQIRDFRCQIVATRFRLTVLKPADYCGTRGFLRFLTCRCDR